MYGVLEEGWTGLEIPHHVRGNPAAARLAGIRQPCGGERICPLERQIVADGSAMATGDVWFSWEFNARAIPGADFPGTTRQFRFSALGSHSGRSISTRRERLRCCRCVWQWMGVDIDHLCPVP